MTVILNSSFGVSDSRTKEWWKPDIYAKAKEIRQRSAKTKMIIVKRL